MSVEGGQCTEKARVAQNEGLPKKILVLSF